MPKIQDLSQLLVEKLQFIYDAEKVQTKQLPKAAKAAKSQKDLVDGLNRHLEQTQGQIERLEEAFEVLGLKPKGKKNLVVQAMVEEANTNLQREAPEQVKLALLVCDLQGFEHWEIAAYGTAIAWSKATGYNKVADLLQESLDEEKEADRQLTELAESVVNKEAASMAEEA